ncbi:winged helix-turn-helix transcriptional regulator [Umezawaea sp. NPDC059074]|uniref:winged helix-turn-helix transcriptional regulator n=1 Tax=Umezawaea sp. NPDC059074 TaxID=3346716 RepID=UPI0036B7D7C6
MVQHVSFADAACPIARSLDHVGEWWSILILRDVTAGLTRFADLQEHLEISPGSLSRRLKDLVASGILEKQTHEYVLTDRGRDFLPVLAAMAAWGYRHFGPEKPAARLVDRATNRTARPVVVDEKTGRPITSATHGFERTAPPW